MAAANGAQIQDPLVKQVTDGMGAVEIGKSFKRSSGTYRSS